MKFPSLLLCCAVLPLLTLSELVGIEESTLAEIAEVEVSCCVLLLFSLFP
jgi:hypothetical protein